ncbi:protein KHNYN [Astyanax mexicanus]|uniref:protein KHNYN n=1 Tax=Astyanax mexicanus TaxID=7994 RepID=UPI0020CB0F64|nr:protein KHNYN [Astyanax mexicanus]XP_049328607.1 protein KHNYN [Astyanax mexicanus]
MALSAVSGRLDRMEGEQQHVEDEFTCPGVLRGALQDLKPTVERVFGVVLRIGGEENSYTAQDGQIWLQLKGRKRDVEAAKLFVKGVVNQEAQQEEQYPEVLHCVFCGAKKFFMGCLIRMTSAHIAVGSPGCLLISGLAEPVVKAYSLIMDLVEKYKNNEIPAIGDSLDSRRVFKSLVEKLEDEYTLDLLALPVRVKEVLLDLVQQSGGDLGSWESSSTSAVPTRLQIQENVDRVVVGEPVARVDHHFALKQNRTLPAHSPLSDFPQTSKSHMYGGQDLDLNRIGHRRPEALAEIGIEREPHNQFLHCGVGDAGFRTRAEGAEGTNQRREQMKLFGDPSQSTDNKSRTDQQEERLPSTGNNPEYEHLLKFFTAMGYDEEVVNRVLYRTGPREPSQVLDLILQEQDKSGTHSSAEAPKQEASLGVTRDAGLGVNVNGAPGTKEDDDFVSGVVKKAAASCGYTEDNVAKVYSNFAELNPHELILSLQNVGRTDPEIPRDDERQRVEEMEEQQLSRKASATLQKVREGGFEVEKSSMTREEKHKNDRGTTLREKTQKNKVIPVKVQPWNQEQEALMELDINDWASKQDLPTPPGNQPFPNIHPFVRGPPQPTYPPTFPPYISDQHMMTPVEPPATKPKHKQGTPPGKTGEVVTGPQRFLEGLQSSFVLQLTNDPGDPGLRQIIIDGSNVAMTHGLGKFFSCRGIALAVQHFWSQGHRKISVFIPQWRQKKDPKTKEHHFMTQLQDLGLLSYTPSREVNGRRINSYDDRFMLHLAQKTDGVIVTNDNMKDLVDESPVWKEIIKKRLLQYLFAGDNFMVPDDPLGRSGPHINDFLRAQNSPPVPASHSFAGVASSFPPPTSQPRAHTEVLHYRERTPGGAGRPQKSGRSPSPPGEKVKDRSVEETQQLKRELVKIFPGQDSVVMMMLQCHPALTDINQLSEFILEQQKDT